MRRVSCVPLGYTRKLNQPFRENKTTVTSPPIWTIQSLEKSVAQLHTFFFKRRVGGRYRSEFAFRRVFSRRLATEGFTWVDSPTSTHTWQTDIVGLFLPPWGMGSKTLGWESENFVISSALKFKSTLPPYPSLGWKISRLKIESEIISWLDWQTVFGSCSV